MADSLIKQCFKKIGNQLDRIIAGLQGKDLAKTYVYRSNGAVDEYEIVGDLQHGSIPNIGNAVKIEIGNKITNIGSNMFEYCSNLTSVTIPSSVTDIEAYAFQECVGLTSVTIPDSVMWIGDYAFSGCTGLPSVTIPDSVMSIGDSAFYNCSGLTSISIPNGVTSIGGDAFNSTSISYTSTFMTMEQIQAMDYYPWGLAPGGTIECSDGYLTVPDSGGSGY